MDHYLYTINYKQFTYGIFKLQYLVARDNIYNYLLFSYQKIKNIYTVLILSDK